MNLASVTVQEQLFMISQHVNTKNTELWVLRMTFGFIRLWYNHLIEVFALLKHQSDDHIDFFEAYKRQLKLTPFRASYTLHNLTVVY